MSKDKLYIEGELFLSLETVAAIYKVQIVWLQQVYEYGLLGTGVDRDATVCIASIYLDRVATIVRLHDKLGLDLDMISVSLDEV